MSDTQILQMLAETTDPYMIVALLGELDDKSVVRDYAESFPNGMVRREAKAMLNI